MIVGIILAVSFGLGLFLIIYLGVKAANNSNIPRADQKKPLYKMSRRELKRLA